MKEIILEKTFSDSLEKTISEWTTEDRKKRFRNVLDVGNIQSIYLEKFMDKMNFFTAPASIGRHGNYEGGLFDHSLCVTQCLISLTERLGLKWERQRSPYIVGMFHDICKCDNYQKINEVWEYKKDSILNGHGEKSVIMLQQALLLTQEEIMCIRWHMGAFDDKENWKFYSRAVNKYPNVLYTHTADMIASQIAEV